jgi:hypothetical protein
MEILTTVSLVFGRPAHVWLGMVLAPLLIVQMIGGFMMTRRGKAEYLKYHKWNAVILGIFALVHLYYALRLYF